MSTSHGRRRAGKRGVDGDHGPSVTEASAIGLLERLFAADSAATRVRTGIGDDAAVVRGSKTNLVWTVDASIEGVHFDLRWLRLTEVGWRSYQAALSDIAAMGATPLAALSSLVMPQGFTRRELAAFARGQAQAAASGSCPVIGGNVARGPSWQITTTVLGEARRPLLRSTARPGDELWLVGSVGLAAAGLRLLRQRRRSAPIRWSAAERACVQAWRAPRALVNEGRQLVGRARAAMDVSDGLLADLPKFAAASGVQVVLVRELLAASLPAELHKAAKGMRLDPVELALSGGEDYALVASGPSKKRPGFARVIGKLREGRGAVLENNGHGACLLEGGFDHFQG